MPTRSSRWNPSSIGQLGDTETTTPRWSSTTVTSLGPANKVPAGSPALAEAGGDGGGVPGRAPGTGLGAGRKSRRGSAANDAHSVPSAAAVPDDGPAGSDPVPDAPA